MSACYSVAECELVAFAWCTSAGVAAAGVADDLCSHLLVLPAAWLERMGWAAALSVWDEGAAATVGAGAEDGHQLRPGLWCQVTGVLVLELELMAWKSTTYTTAIVGAGWLPQW